MHRFLALAVLPSLLAVPLVAQDNSRIEVFGGYQYLRVGNADGGGAGLNLNGWNASATVNINKYLGVAADFSGSYKTLFAGTPISVDLHTYTYTFGPVVSLHSGLFAHALFGGVHSIPTACTLYSGSPDECGSGIYNGFAMMLGGGLDVRARKSIAIRVFQIDWVRLPFKEGGENANMRFSTGLVFRF
jgi:hypothetical protein